MPSLDSYADFLNQQLEQKLPGMLTRRTPNLPFAMGMYLPAIADVAVGAQYQTKEVMDSLGEALIFSESSSDIPFVSTSVDEKGYRVVTLAAGVKWTHSELESASYANVDLVTRRTSHIPRAFDEAIQKIALVGSAKHGFTGFFNNANIPSVASTYNPNTGTADDALDFVNTVIASVATRTNLTSGVEVLLVPEKVRLKWARLKLSGTSVSVLAQILDDYGVAKGGTLRAIVGINECQSDVLEAYGAQAAGTNRDLIMAIPVSPDAASRGFNARRPTALEGPRDLVYKQIYLQSTSEARIDYPSEFGYYRTTKMT